MDDVKKTDPPKKLQFSLNGQTFKLTEAQFGVVQAAGISEDLMMKLVQLFGPFIWKLLVRMLEQKAKQNLQFSAGLDFLDSSYLRNMLADVLRLYKSKLGDVSKEWVEKGLEELAEYIDTDD